MAMQKRKKEKQELESGKKVVNKGSQISFRCNVR